MAFRTWGRLLLTALGVSVLAGAGQLGVAYGFGVVRLDGAFADGSVNRWPAQLAWVGWFAAVAAVAGTVLTERLARRDGFPGGTTEQLSVAGAAALGAIVVAPLCMQPARAAELGGTVDPVWAVGICAILGAVVGAGASIAVLLKPPFGWNIVLTAAAVWLLALLSVAPAVASTRPLRTVRLGVLEPSWLDAGAAQRLAMLILPAVALLAGAAVGALARRRGHLPLVGGAAGAAGPVLLAFAYLTAGPGDAADRYQLAPYYGALIAVAAGALGSAATTVLRRPAAAAGSAAIEPTDILQPLPPSPAVAAAPAAGSAALATRAGTDGTLAPATGQPAAAGHTPAHWDWPASPGVTPVPAGRASRVWDEGTEIRRDDLIADDRPAEAAPASGSGAGGPDDPVWPGRHGEPGRAAPARAGLGSEPDDARAGLSSAPAGAGREIEDLVPSLPVPGLLPPGRRTAAIDVLAAGRPLDPAGPARGAQPADARPAERRDRDADGRPAQPEPLTPTADGAPRTGPTSGHPARRPTPVPAPTVPAPGSASSDAPSAAQPSSPVAAEPGPPQAPAAPAEPVEPSTPATAEFPVPAAKRGARATRESSAPATADADPSVPAAEVTTPAPAAPRSRRQRAVPAAAGAASPEPAVSRTAPPPAGPEAPATGTPVVPGRPAGRAKRPRKGRTTPAATEPAATPSPTAPADAPAVPDAPPAAPVAAASPAVPDGPPSVPVAASPDGPATTDGAARERRFFFDPEPVAAERAERVDAPASPRPRFPIFEDLSDGPGSVRPAWPIPTASQRPVAPPRNGDDPDGTGGDGPIEPPRVEPAPRPRHRALPDLGRGAAWDAFATTRPTTPAAGEDPRPGEDGRHAANASAGTPGDDDPQTGESPAAPTEPAEETDTGKAKQRRGLFRRNRAKEAAAPEPEALGRDEEYVDWVAGLASDDDPDDAGTLRTGRHHRD